MFRKTMKGLLVMLVLNPFTGLAAGQKPGGNLCGGLLLVRGVRLRGCAGRHQRGVRVHGGTTEDPTYEDVSSGSTGHAEAVQVTYDPKRVTYSRLLDVFWRQIDPTDGGQFVDRGSQYRTGIFYHTDEQRRLAEESKKNLERSGKYHGPIITEITRAGKFYPAEDYHQDYFRKNSIRYKFYRHNSGRDQYLRKTWGTRPPAPSDCRPTRRRTTGSRAGKP